jgi:hypothetical protein
MHAPRNLVFTALLLAVASIGAACAFVVKPA